jgi:hypothetical protein
MGAPTRMCNITTVTFLLTFLLFFFSFFFSQSRSGRTERRTNMNDGSNGAVSREEVPFGGLVDVCMH